MRKCSGGSIYRVLLVSGWFAVSQTIIPEAQEHFLTPTARRDTHLFGGLGLTRRSRISGNSVKAAWAAGVAIALLLTIACGARTAIFSDNNSSGTWSVVAVDADAAEVGVALATCVADDFKLSQSTVGGSGDDVGRTMYQIYVDTFLFGNVELARLLPGHGAIVAQAAADPWNSDRIDSAASRLLADASAQDVVAAATSGDSELQARQYGVATLAHGEANVTGAENEDWAGGVSGPSVSTQGNILVGPTVVSAPLEVFQEVMKQPGAVLSDGLVAALEAGAMQGGDSRCPREQAAQSAFLAVARTSDQGDTLSRWLTVPPQGIGEQREFGGRRHCGCNPRPGQPQAAPGLR